MSREITPLPPQVLLHLTALQELNPFPSPSARSVPVYSPMKALDRARSSDHQHLPQLARCWGVIHNHCPLHGLSRFLCPFPRTSTEQSQPQYFAWHGHALDEGSCYSCRLILTL